MNLRVRNYQAARDVNLLIEGLTVLKGQSNVGKSSVLKALYAATHNRFRRGCVSWDEDSCVVQLRYTGEENILRVERSAMGASPKVSLGTKAKGYKTFSKMNRDLPAEVQNYNNFGYIQVTPQEKLSLNFCTQFAPPLMVRFSNKRIVDILSYSKATADAAKAKKWLDEKQVYLKGEFSAMDSAISSTKEHLGELQKEERKFKHCKQVQDHMSEALYLRDDLEKFKQLLELLAEQKFLTLKKATATKVLSEAKKALEKQIECGNFNSLSEELRIKGVLLKKVKFLKSVKLPSEDERKKLTKMQTLLELLSSKESLQKKVEAASRVKGVIDTKMEIVRRHNNLNMLLYFLEHKEEVKADLRDAVNNRSNMVCPICGTRITE